MTTTKSEKMKKAKSAPTKYVRNPVTGRTARTEVQLRGAAEKLPRGLNVTSVSDGAGVGVDVGLPVSAMEP